VCNLEDNDDHHPHQQQHDEAHDSPAHHAHLNQSQRSTEETAQHVSVRFPLADSTLYVPSNSVTATKQAEFGMQETVYLQNLYELQTCNAVYAILVISLD